MDPPRPSQYHQCDYKNTLIRGESIMPKECQANLLLAALALWEGALRAHAPLWTASVISRQTYRAKRDGIAASGTMIIIVLHYGKRDAGLSPALWTGYKCLASCHTRISFLLQICLQSEKPPFPGHIHGIGGLYSYCVQNTGLGCKYPGTTSKSHLMA